MYIKTPKKYRRTARRSIFPFGRMIFMLVMVMLIIAGIGLYQNRDAIQPYIDNFASTAVANVELSAATLTAPTPLPTRDPTTDLVQANNYWVSGSISEAMRLYMPVLPSVPNDVETHQRVTIGLVAQGRADEALEYAERTVTADPFSSDAWAVRAWVQSRAGESGQAIASALHAKELDPNNARALAYLAEAYFASGQTQRAMNTLEQALDIDPDSIEAMRARGYIKWVGLFDLDGAMQDLQQSYDMALDLNPALASLIAVDVAQLMIGRGNYNGAISVLESVLEVNPENTQALYWIGSVYFGNLGDPNQANRYLLTCVDYNPDSIGCNYMLGRTQYSLDQTVTAAESFEKAISLGSTNPYHLWWAGRSQIALGNCARALDYLREGYEIALRGTNDQIIDDYEAILPMCGADFGPRTTPDDETGDEEDETENFDGENTT